MCLVQLGPFVPVIPVEILAPALDQILPAPDRPGHEHRTPVTAEATGALEEARQHNHASGDAPVLPALRDPSTCVSGPRMAAWRKSAERRAGLEPKRGRGWHSLRRKFATDLMGLPLKVLCDLGGWKEAQTVLRCYQRTAPESYLFVPASLTGFVDPVPAV